VILLVRILFPNADRNWFGSNVPVTISKKLGRVIRLGLRRKD
jgi:hypothetical protein